MIGLLIAAARRYDPLSARFLRECNNREEDVAPTSYLIHQYTNEFRGTHPQMTGSAVQIIGSTASREKCSPDNSHAGVKPPSGPALPAGRHCSFTPYINEFGAAVPGTAHY
jgi:hypothetical protein